MGNNDLSDTYVTNNYNYPQLDENYWRMEFAKAALHAEISSGRPDCGSSSIHAQWAFALADAMIEEAKRREK